MAQILLDVFTALIPAGIVAIVAMSMMKQMIRSEIRRERFVIKREAMKDILPIRLQAYERLTVFIDRIRLENIVARQVPQGDSAQIYKMLLIQTIRQEYEHNISQQIYVSMEAWNFVELAKMKIASQIQAIAKELPKDATAKDLYEGIMKVTIQQKQKSVCDQALTFLKKDVQKIF